MDGREGRKGLEDRVINGEALVAFSVRGVSVNQIMDIADNNQLLPPKVIMFFNLFKALDKSDQFFS